jgi:hypothetical protein
MVLLNPLLRVQTMMIFKIRQAAAYVLQMGTCRVPICNVRWSNITNQHCEVTYNHVTYYVTFPLVIFQQRTIL